MQEQDECSELLSSELDWHGRRGEYPGEGTMKSATQRRWGSLLRPRPFSAGGLLLGSLEIGCDTVNVRHTFIHTRHA